MNYEFKSFHCELLKNKILYNFTIKLFYLLLKKLKKLKIPNISKYIQLSLLDKKYTKEYVIKTNGLNCYKNNICSSILKINDIRKFYIFIKKNNITIMQITGAIYSLSSMEIIYRRAIRDDKQLSKDLVNIYNDLFGANINNFSDIEKIAKKSEGYWFIPLIYIYGREKRTNIVTAGLNYDKVYIREALGYSRKITKKDFNIYKMNDNDCFKYYFNGNNIVMGDSYFKIIKNGIFENLMKKYKKEIVSGFSGSSIMIYFFIFNTLKLLKKTVKNESLILFMIILDFYPIHHSIAEILVTYTRETINLKNYNLTDNELSYLKKYNKFISSNK